MPVKLTALAPHKAVFAKEAKIAFRAENAVYGRCLELSGDGRQRFCNALSDEKFIMVGMMKQALPPNRCERYADQQFWIIGHAVTLISIGPCPIEDEFAVRMRFEVARRTTDEVAIQVYSQMARCPA